MDLSPRDVRFAQRLGTAERAAAQNYLPAMCDSCIWQTQVTDFMPVGRACRGDRADVRADGACITDSSRRAHEELGRGDLGLSGI